MDCIYIYNMLCKPEWKSLNGPVQWLSVVHVHWNDNVAHWSKLKLLLWPSSSLHYTEVQLKCVGVVSVQQPCRLLWTNPSPIVTFPGSNTVTLQINRQTHTMNHNIEPSHQLHLDRKTVCHVFITASKNMSVSGGTKTQSNKEC